MVNKIKNYENQKAYNKKQRISKWFVVYVKNDDHLFDSIRNKPDFQQIAGKMEAKYRAEHERVRKWLEETGQL